MGAESFRQPTVPKAKEKNEISINNITVILYASDVCDPWRLILCRFVHRPFSLPPYCKAGMRRDETRQNEMR